MEDRLWDWLDGRCSAEEAGEIRRLVDTDAAWKSRHEELSALHQSLKTDLELMQPSMRFTRNVMDQIAAMGMQATARSYLNNKVIYTVGGLLVALLTGIIVYAIALVDWAAGGSSFNLPDSGVGSVAWGRILQGPLGTAAAVVMGVLSLVLADQLLRQKWMNKRQRV